MVAYAAQGDSDRWHVVLGPGETKVLTLEQLDDLFRLEVIDAQTKIWQPGMREWLPLSVVAGLDDDEDEAPSQVIPVTPPPAPSARRPPPPSASRPAPPVVVVAANRPQPIPLVAPAGASAWPALANTSAAAQPVLAESLRPVSFAGSVAPPQRSGRAGSFVIGLAVVTGLALTFYRNGLVRDLALSTHNETAFLSLESALGGPGFGTPRALDALPKLAAAAAPLDGTELGAGLGGTKLESEQAKSSTQSTGSESGAGSARPGSNVTSSRKPNDGSLESLVAAQRGTKQSGTKKSEKASSAPAPRSRAAEPPAKNLGIRGSSNKFDPLNGKL